MSDSRLRAIASLRLPHTDPATIAMAIAPDDTDEINTRYEDEVVISTVERTNIGGLRSTLDDLLVNLDVAIKTAQLSDQDPNPTTNE